MRHAQVGGGSMPLPCWSYCLRRSTCARFSLASPSTTITAEPSPSWSGAPSHHPRVRHP